MPILTDLSNHIDYNGNNNFNKHLEISNSLYDNNLLDNAAFASRPKTSRVKKHKKSKENGGSDGGDEGNAENGKKNKRKKMNKKKEESLEDFKASNATSDSYQKKRKYRKENKHLEGMKWKSYYDRSTISPLHPRRIIQEFTY